MWELLPCCLLSSLMLFLFLAASFPESLSSSANPCSHEESIALLHFKQSFSVDSSASMFCEAYLGGSSSSPKTESWKESKDCCSWDGVTCDRLTGHVIGLDLSSSQLLGPIHSNSSLFLLHHLQKLNLACNDFSQSEISSKFGQFMKLTHLNLSLSNFCSLIPAEISQLSKLVSLDLSHNYCPDGELILPPHGFSAVLQNLTELRVLHLDHVNMSSVAPNSLVNLSSFLISLSLSEGSLQGEFPNNIFHFPSLKELILSANDLSGNLPKSNWTSPLRLLDLSSTYFSGIIHDTIGNLIYLNELHLFGCDFEGSIPPSLWNLTAIISLDLAVNNFSGQVSASLSNLGKLTSLDLSWNKFSGQFPDVFGNLSKLTSVSLAGNNFSGQLPSSAFNHVQLAFVDFNGNQLEGHIPQHDSGISKLVGKIPPVCYLDLSNNKLTGTIPDSLFEHVNLNCLFLSSNNFSGILKSNMFAKLKSLVTANFSNNNFLSYEPHHKVKPTLPKLENFRFSSCNLTEFPIFLKNSRRLQILDLSDNKIPDQISKRELENWQSLTYLDLSKNFLISIGDLSLMIKLQTLNLESNLLNGSLVDLPTSIKLFSASNNKLTGQIPPSFCNLSSMEQLELSNNSLSGTIPKCLGNLNVLSSLDLRMNNFHGSIPKTWASGPITYLNLNGNQLEGPLPTSLANCTELEVLDVGNNIINDTFPHWLSSLPILQVVVLRSNRFHGPIGNSSTRFPFTKLQILDLSHNQFTGLLPARYFENFKAMMHSDDNSDEGYMGDQTSLYIATKFPSYYYSITLTLKGVNMEIERILKIFRALDLSNNKFQGQIPEIVGKFNSLEVLNLSHNNLTGHIPLLLGNLTKLESLDLSANKLVGEIPKQLTSLTSLSVMNLSNNQLVGPIPQGPQFNTFQNDSYLGNLGLCGFPLSKKCTNADKPKSTPTTFSEEDDNGSWFDWKIAMMGYGCGLVIGLSIGYMVFATRKPQWFIRMVEWGRSNKVRRLNRRHRGRRH